MDKQREILVVEDDAAVRNLIATTLDVHGYRHREATTGAQALLELTSSSSIDLAILDLGLPDMDGVDVIRSLRGWSHMPVIVVSARLEDADKVEALDAGADDYLTKPFSVEELLARLRVALRRLSYIAAEDEDERAYRNGGWSLITSPVALPAMGGEVHLTPIEYKCWSARPQHGQGAHSQLHSEGGVGGRRSRPTSHRFASSWPLCARRLSPILRIPCTCRRMWASDIA